MSDTDFLKKLKIYKVVLKECTRYVAAEDVDMVSEMYRGAAIDLVGELSLKGKNPLSMYKNQSLNIGFI